MEEQSENLNKPKISYVYIKPNYNYLYIIFSVLLIVLVGSFLFNFLISKVLIKDALISNPIPGMYIKSLQNTYFIEGKFINAKVVSRDITKLILKQNIQNGQEFAIYIPNALISSNGNYKVTDLIGKESQYERLQLKLVYKRNTYTPENLSSWDIITFFVREGTL